MSAILEAIRGMLDGIREASPTNFIAMCAIPALIMALLVRVGIKWRHISSLIAKTPVVPIGSAVEGIAAVEGTAEAVRGPLKATLTGTPCLWYRTLIEHQDMTVHSKGGASVNWSKQKGTESRVPFLLRDASGVCEVRALGDYVTPTDRSVWFGNTKVPRNLQPEKVPGSVPLSEIHARQSGSEQAFRYTEERIYAGDHVYVLGQFFKTPLNADDEVEEHHDVESDDSNEDEAKTSERKRRGFDAGNEDESAPRPASPAALRITQPADKHHPLVVSGIGADAARRFHAMRSKGMFILATFFAAILGFLFWVHFAVH